MLQRIFDLLYKLLLPLIFLLSFLLGGERDEDNSRSGPDTAHHRMSVRESLRKYNIGFLSSFLTYENRKEAGLSIPNEIPEDMAAKAIADSLVTQTLPGAQQQASRRRSVRISQMKNDDFESPSVKSPTSAALSPEIIKRAKTRASGTSKPLIPSKPSRKTLILDLDETLIHSLSKGGKSFNGHMIEVRLGTHAILYYVYKRPHCDLFLEKVSQWYDVVIFTASVQEYADPVIDWLEQERKYFKARYYRQHCTYRYGAYMKDLSIVQPDLSRAIIVDNSPLSYRMNEENAVPIEGWISDPSDRDLLHLIPVLQNLHLVHDVRSLLSLRQPD